MALLLRSSSDLAEFLQNTPWIAVTGTRAPAGLGAKMADAPRLLEEAFDSVRDEWWAIGKALGAGAGAEFAHAPTAASYASDFGIMLAWTRLARKLAAGDPVLMVCDDPWLFRHLSGLPGVQAGRAPPMWPRRLRLAVRGVLARARLALRLAWTTLALRSHRRRPCAPGGTTFLVYGHPASEAEGGDAYFGSLMRDLDGVSRALHTDCPSARARELAAAGRAVSLHAWGSVGCAFGLVFTRWRPSLEESHGAHGWLVRRAAALEGSRAGAAATRWQMACQRAWLDATTPKTVVWPWENHPWERDLVRAARRRGVRTIGYQHTVIGRHMFNQSPATNPDGLASLPDLILCNGPAYRRQLEAWGVPAARLAIGGALRIAVPQRLSRDPEAPVFVALSSDADISAQMMAAVRAAARSGRRFAVKDHPMYPFPFAESAAIRRTTRALPAYGPVAAVLYATGTVGLEALLAGLPTLRFRPEGRIAIDILPDGIAAVPVDAASLDAALAAIEAPPAIDRESILAPVDLAVWKRYLTAA